MAGTDFQLKEATPNVVGSFGGPDDLRISAIERVRASCDLVEIRLDLLAAGSNEVKSTQWRHLRGVPMLFTARRHEEGGALPLDVRDRMKLLESSLEDASLIDIEVASISQMAPLLSQLRVPWIASFHDFEKLPDTKRMLEAAQESKDAGAAAFKIAAKVHCPADIARLADFQLTDHGLPVATMGMGPLAPVSRLLCAQCGSVLNYGYLGETPTAPGQWDAAVLKQAVSRLVPFRL